MSETEHWGVDMTDIERREMILRQLKSNYSVKVAQLSKQLFIGEATIRRDLKKLENAGYLKRVYGGAVRIDAVDRELPADVRQTDNLEAKLDLCKVAAGLIHDGNVLALDSSTTVQFLGDYLAKFTNITVLTQGQKLMERLQYAPVNLYCAGGLLQKTTLSYNGTFTRNFFASFHTDIAFISCKGISMQHGLSWVYEEEACVRKVMLENAKKRVLLCDHTKFDEISSCKLFGFEMIDYLVTDSKPSQQWIDFLQQQNITLLYPNSDSPAG